MSEDNIKQYIDNMIWYIETNRKTMNDDSGMLDNVYTALKNIQNSMNNKKNY